MLCRALGRHVLNLPRIELLIRLELDGFHSADAPPPCTADGPMLYRLGRPVSYYACLLLRREVFAKDVSEISHCQSNHYYICLIKLGSVQLSTVLPSIAGKRDDWFRSQLERPGVCAKIGSGPPLPLTDGAGSAEVNDMVPVLADDVGWTRVNVSGFDSLGSPLNVKVYFDGATKLQQGDLTQRGFCNCVQHAADECIKYRFVCGTRDMFAAKMWMWVKDGLDKPEVSKAAHLKHWPTDEEAGAVVARLTFREF